MAHHTNDQGDRVHVACHRRLRGDRGFHFNTSIAGPNGEMTPSSNSLIPLKEMYPPEGAWMQWQERVADRARSLAEEVNIISQKMELHEAPYYRNNRSVSLRFIRIGQVESESAKKVFRENQIPPQFLLMTPEDVRGLGLQDEVFVVPDPFIDLLKQSNYPDVPEGKLYYYVPSHLRKGPEFLDPDALINELKKEEKLRGEAIGEHFGREVDDDSFGDEASFEDDEEFDDMDWEDDDDDSDKGDNEGWDGDDYPRMPRGF